MIGIDTFSWNKLILLYHSEWKDVIDELLKKFNFFITTEGKKEFEYRYNEDKALLENITIFPVIKGEIYVQYLKKYDPTDASLLEYSDVNGYRIITEDRPLLEEGITTKRNIIQLIDFFYEIYKRENFFTRTEMYQLLKQFRKWKNVKQGKVNYYKSHL